MKDEFKRKEQEGTELRCRDWRDRFEGVAGPERKALRRKARRKMHAELAADPPTPGGEHG